MDDFEKCLTEIGEVLNKYKMMFEDRGALGDTAFYLARQHAKPSDIGWTEGRSVDLESLRLWW